MKNTGDFSGKIQQVCADQKCSGSTDDSRENKTVRKKNTFAQSEKGADMEKMNENETKDMAVQFVTIRLSWSRSCGAMYPRVS